MYATLPHFDASGMFCPFFARAAPRLTSIAAHYAANDYAQASSSSSSPSMYNSYYPGAHDMGVDPSLYYHGPFLSSLSFPTRADSVPIAQTTPTPPSSRCRSR
jgi:hypothetical protein